MIGPLTRFARLLMLFVAATVAAAGTMPPARSAKAATARYTHLRLSWPG